MAQTDPERGARWALGVSLVLWFVVAAFCLVIGLGARSRGEVVSSRVAWMRRADAIRERLDAEGLRRATVPPSPADPRLAAALRDRSLVDEAPASAASLAAVWDVEAPRVLAGAVGGTDVGGIDADDAQSAAAAPTARLALGLAQAITQVRDEVSGVSRALDAAWRGLFAVLGLALAASAALALVLHRARGRLAASTAALAASEERYRRFFEGTQAPLLVVDPASGAILDANAAAAAFHGWPVERLRQMTMVELASVPADEERTRLAACADRAGRYESQVRHADGRTSDVEVYAGPFEVRGRRRLFVIMHDVTERRRLAERVREAEKMEALGRMAGGVANDINNLLTVVLGQAQIARISAADDGPVADALREIERSVDRGAGLTATLLALARSRAVERVPVDLGALFADAEPDLRARVGVGVRLEVQTPRAEIAVLADPSQMREALGALVQNATDAIRGDGAIRISAQETDARAARAAGARELSARAWVAVDVADTGAGIPAEARGHLFEPFFTTKPGRTSRGLGLAMVYGVAVQNGGAVTVESSPGAGTTVTLWLPRADASRA